MEFVGGQEVVWSKEPNGSRQGRQAWTDRRKRGHDYVPQRERRQRKSLTDNQQHTHTCS